jgi:protoheme IX farnesyltransferase
MNMFRTYYQLTKPGIIYGNLLSLLAGFLFASHFHISISLLLGSVIGVGLVIACGCVINNVFDRNIDARMQRTQNRAIVKGVVSIPHALVYASILGIVGFIVLFRYTNVLTALLGIIGLFFYVVLYGYAKRTTIYSTWIGSVSGAMPILAGYTTVTNRIDTAGILLFIIMVFWQMPHFYAIAIYHLQEYTDAQLILWPIKRGVKETKIQMVVFIILFTIASILLTILGYKRIIFAFVMLIICGIWLYKVSIGFTAIDQTMWGKQSFLFSLIVLLTLCTGLAIPFI